MSRRLFRRVGDRQLYQSSESLESRVLFATTTITPIADAYTRDGASQFQNFGTDPQLLIKGTTTVDNIRRTLLKFDISGTSAADNVTLRLHGSAATSSPSVQLQVYAGSDTTWGQTTVNASNEPVANGSPLSTRTISGTTDQWYTWDVTQYIQAEQQAGHSLVTLLVLSPFASTSNPVVEFDSRESAFDPELLLTTNDGGTPPPPASALRIDAAGGPTNASGGAVFAADAGFNGGFANTDTFAVAGTTDDALYSTRRTGDFSYSNAVANGDYTLNLLFADYKAPGQRKFNVSVEGQQKLTNFDIVAAAGANTALVESFPVTISDGKLDMNFTSVVSNAALSAFELVPVDSPAFPLLSINDVTKAEGNSGTTAFTFTITRSGDTSGAVTVQYDTSNQSTDNNDLTPASGIASFAAGETTRQVTVNVNGDTTVESDEIFLVALGATTGGAQVNDGIGVGKILNDDSVTPPTLPTLSIGDAMGNEGNSGNNPLTFTVTRTGDTSGSSTVNWATQNGTAGEGDYVVVATGTVSFDAGQTSQILVVNMKGDTKVEGNETFFVNLSGASGATISDGQGQGTIVNDDGVGQSGTINNITWSRNGPRSPVPRTEGGVIQIGSKVYAIGGFTATGGTGTFFPLTRRVDVYNMATRTWSQLASMPSQAGANHFGAATDGANIYTIAGQITDTYGQGTSTAWKYNIASNSWSSFPSLPEIRFGGTAFILNGWLHFVAGAGADRHTDSAMHWAIDLSNTGAGWSARPPIPRAADHLTSAVINGKAYVFGGENGHEGLNGQPVGTYIQHNDVYEYNPDTDTWTQKANMPQGTSHVEGSTLVINGQAVIIGGLLNGGGNNENNLVQVYNPVSNTWKTLTTRFPKRISGATAGYWNGVLYMADGYSPDESDRQVGFEGTVSFG